jgi:hypothetical protein
MSKLSLEAINPTAMVYQLAKSTTVSGIKQD